MQCISNLNCSFTMVTECAAKVTKLKNDLLLKYLIYLITNHENNNLGKKQRKYSKSKKCIRRSFIHQFVDETPKQLPILMSCTLSIQHFHFQFSTISDEVDNTDISLAVNSSNGFLLQLPQIPQCWRLTLGKGVTLTKLPSQIIRTWLKERIRTAEPQRAILEQEEPF